MKKRQDEEAAIAAANLKKEKAKLAAEQKLKDDKAARDKILKQIAEAEAATAALKKK